MRIAHALSVALPSLFLAGFVGWPVVNLLASHLRAGDILDVLTDTSLRRVAWFTLWQAALSSVMSTAVGLPLTWAIARWRFPGSRLLTGLVTVSFLMPAVTMAVGVSAIIDSRGIPAILWAHVAFNVAVVVRVVGPAWALVDRSQLESAASLGASPLRVFTDVTWPAISGAVRGAAALVFAFCYSSFAIVSVLGGPTIRTLETEVFTRAVRLGDINGAAALSLMQTVVVVVVLVTARRGPATTASTIDYVGTQSLSERARWRYLPPVVAVLGAAPVVAPLLMVLIRSARLDGSWSLAGWRMLVDGSLESVGVNLSSVARASIGFAVATACLSVTLAVLTCRRVHEGVVERLSMFPLLVSAVTLGLGIIVTFDSDPFDWRARPWLIPVVHTTIALPLAVRVVGAALRGIGDDLVESAADLGASPFRAGLTVLLPLMRPALLRAAGISAAVSFGEFGATSFLSRSGTMTVPIAIGQLMGRPGDALQQAAFALAAVAIIASGAVLSRA